MDEKSSLMKIYWWEISTWALVRASFFVQKSSLMLWCCKGDAVRLILVSLPAPRCCIDLLQLPCNWHSSICKSKMCQELLADLLAQINDKGCFIVAEISASSNTRACENSSSTFSHTKPSHIEILLKTNNLLLLQWILPQYNELLLQWILLSGAARLNRSFRSEQDQTLCACIVST